MSKRNLQMTISMFNYGNALAAAKRHYNLAVDDFIVVDGSAMVLARSVYHAPYITIAVSPERFDALKKFPLRPCEVKNHIRLTDNVLCRRLKLPEVENRRWVGNCYTVTREYLVADLNEQLQGRSVSKKRQLDIQRELKLLSYVDAHLTATSNKAKAISRIRSVALYMGVEMNELVVLGQTIACLRDDVKTDNDILFIGYDTDKLAKVRSKVTFPHKSETFENGKAYKGYEIDPNVYVMSVPKDLYDAVIDETGMTYCNILETQLQAFKLF